MLEYHAEYACTDTTSGERIARLLGLRDEMMAENLAFVVRREPGKVLAFAHNSHLKCGETQWQLGPDLLKWRPAGSHIREMLGERYSVIGAGLGTCDASGIGPPEPGTLEALLTSAPGAVRFVPTYRGKRLPAELVANLPTRSTEKNPGYFPLTKESLAEFDWLAVLDRCSHQPENKDS
jgi:erythromycin esterase-like protein